MKPALLSTLMGVTSVALTACNADEVFNTRPDFVIGNIQHQDYDGQSDDLLTAGLGAAGLASATAPAFTDPLAPTAAELRRLAIYNNYRALVDTSPGGGYGHLFGPAVGNPGDRIPGREFIARMVVPGTTVPVTVMAQVPDAFDPEFPCMVTAPSSGSRGIYGAIGTAGEWGLKKGCTVVYTDKGTGTGAHNLATNTGQTVTGTLTGLADEALFLADLAPDQRERFNSQWPDRFAWKHAHSRQNPESDWGQQVLQSIEFGFYVLNTLYGRELGNGNTLRTITPRNTLVIASSVSNGGGASVRAAEQDDRGLIDGVAVSEPNVNPAVDRGFTIRQGDGPVIADHSRSLLDYTTALAVYQGCANQTSLNRDSAPLNAVFNPPETGLNICHSLFNKGLVSGATPDDWATDAQRILNNVYGVQPEQNLLAPLHFGLAVAQSISMTYANAYARAGVEDRVCGLSLAATDSAGAVVPLAPAAEAALFAVSNGIPPTAGVNLVYDNAEGQPTNLAISASPSSSQVDYGLDALLCLKSLADGEDVVTGTALTGAQAELSDAMAGGVAAIRASGNLQRKPAVFVTGRADAVLPINHTSRPYVGLNQRVEGRHSQLRYYEILNAHHLDVLNGLPGVGDRYVPLHYYYFQALDLIWAHLTEKQPLPPSQVVRPVPRASLATPLSEAHLPAIQPAPAETDRIIFTGSQLRIPD